MEACSVWVTTGPVVRIDGTLPSNAPVVLERAGAFQKDGSWWCLSGQWPRVERTLKALGVLIGSDGAVGEPPKPKRSLVSLNSVGEVQMQGDLPRHLRKEWLGRIQNHRYVGMSPWALPEYADACAENGLGVEMGEDAKGVLTLVEQRLVDVTQALTMPDDDLPDVKLANPDDHLWPFQRRTLAVFQALGGSILIGDEPGLGKTLQAIAIKRFVKAERVLVIAPSVAKGNWRDEIRRFDGQPSLILDGYNDRGRTVPEGQQWLIVNYEVLADQERKVKGSEAKEVRKGWLDALRAWKPDFVVCDESHFLKGTSSERTKACRVLTRGARWRALMSGTPMANSPIDLYSQLDMAQPRWWGAWFQFGLAFSDGKRTRFGWDFGGISRADILHRRLALAMIRRRKEDVLKDLPPQTRTQYRVALEPEARREYDGMLAEYREYIRKLLEEGKSVDGAKGRRLDFIMKLRQISSRGRIRQTAELASNLIEEGKHPIVFAYFRESMDNLHAAFAQRSVTVDGKSRPVRVAMIDGRTPRERRDEIKDAFNAGKLDVLVGQTKAMGIAINLQKGSDLTITHELTYEPIDIEQTEGRVYRAGQTSACQHVYMLGDDTRDDKILGILLKKFAAGEAILGGATVEDDLLKEIEADFFQEAA